MEQISNEISHIERERKQLLAEIRALTPGEEALRKLTYLRKEYDWGLEDYRNSLKILSDTTYQDRKHFLLELIQNADDATFPTSKAGLTFIIYNDRLELRYNETGFTVDNVIAITGTGASTKRNKNAQAHSFIGEKGIGFKSVFALAKEVEIESPPWHFALKKDQCIVPELRKEGLMHLGQGTRLVVRFSDSSVLDIVAQELFNYVSGQVESFLFLQKLSQLQVEDRRNSQPIVRNLCLEPTDRQGEAFVLTTQPDNQKREYVLYSEELAFPPELVAERWEQLSSDGAPLKRKLMAAAMVQFEENPKDPGRLYCFLPTEVKLPVPIFLQVDGHTKADRERLHDPEQNRWNHYLLQHLPSFIVKAILAWRTHPQLSSSLLNYVPVNSGSDQLAPVFAEVIRILRKAPWVSTFESDVWAEPEKVVRVNGFLEKWFIKDPAFRQRAEAVVGLKFVNPQWTQDKRRQELWSKYGILSLSEEQKADILSLAKFPQVILVRDSNLVELYTEINTFKALSQSKFDPSVCEKLLRAPIFPQENDLFGPLKTPTVQNKIFWIAGRSRRVTGLEGSVDYRIINTEYTYRPDAGGDATPERIMEVKRINERNNIVRQLLTNLEVLELNDDTLLTKLQIPWLTDPCRTQEKSNKQCFNVLKAMFEAYRAKRSPEKDYLAILNLVGEAFFPSTSGQILKLKHLLLPDQLRIEPNDHLYDKPDVQVLVLPAALLTPSLSEAKQMKWERESERRQKLLEDWRKFLIYCGIKGKPRFEITSWKYSSPSEFAANDKRRCNLWKNLIVDDYTHSNPVEVKVFYLDEGTREVLKRGNYDHPLMARNIYSAWQEEFHDQEVKIDNSYWNMYYRGKLLPGYFQTLYRRRDNRSPLVRDYLWGGVAPDCLPLETARGDCVSAARALRIPTRSLAEILTAVKYLPVVRENKGDGPNYASAYLDSLAVRQVKVSDCNSLWAELDQALYSDILAIAIELLRIGLPDNGLQIYDQESGKLRPVTLFRLGLKGPQGVPLLEVQYGALGRLLGELLGLPEENDVSVYQELFQRIYSEDKNWNAAWEQEIAQLLRKWSTLELVIRTQISASLQEAWRASGATGYPVLVINNPELWDNFRSLSLKALKLTSRESEVYAVEKAAKELGFSLPQDLGNLEVKDETDLGSAEAWQFQEYVRGYLRLLEQKELARLTSKLSNLGPTEAWATRIFRVSKLYRVLDQEGKLNLELPLPYLEDNRKFLVPKSMKPKEILAQLLSSCEFTPLRDALRNLNEIKLARSPFETNKTPEDNQPSLSEMTSNLDSSPRVDGKVRVKTSEEELLSIQQREAVEQISSNEVEDSIAPLLNPSGVANRIWAGMKDDRIAAETEAENSRWKSGLTPEQEEELRLNLQEQLAAALKAGPVAYTQKLRNHKTTQRNLSLSSGDSKLTRERISSRPENITIIEDPGKGDPKGFLLAEYDGHCQVCATELKLSNGSKWVEIFHIEELREGSWWGNRPFNTLGLCPNCHALAKHGGNRDLTNIYLVANAVSEGQEFPIELPEYQGDFYTVPVRIAGVNRRLVMSKLHLSYFAALITKGEVAATQEEHFRL